MRRSITVGLTGQTGAGKTLVAELLGKYGYKVLSADDMAHLLTERGSPMLPKLAEAFGQDILLEDGSLNRKRLAALAFQTPAATATLNRIMHPEICRMLLKKRDGAFFDGYEGVIFDASQLFESGLHQKCGMIISVTAPEALRLERIRKRDGITEAEARRRMSAQLPESYFLEHSDIIIENRGDEARLRDLVTQTARIIEQRISGEI